MCWLFHFIKSEIFCFSLLEKGSGRECRPATSCYQMNCDANAECVPHPQDSSRFRCQCRPGYIGDGTICQVKDATSLCLFFF